MTGRLLPHDWFPEPLPDNVLLGERNWLYSSFAFRHCQSRRPTAVRTDHDTGIYNGTFFDLGPEGEVSIGAYCTLVGAIICSNSRIEIQDYVFIAHEVVLADHFAAEPTWQFSTKGQGWEATDGAATSIFVGENAWIGARAVLLKGARIGEGAIVGAAAVVDFAVPPFAVVGGNPARIVRVLGEGSM
ncbi:MAG TPA: acyltransferase [Rhodothermia bacterium]